MISVIVPLLLQAALRALFAAVAVWAGLRILRIGNVVVQKAAWGLVLVAAIALPLAPRWQGLPFTTALNLPTIHWSQASAPDAAAASTPTPAPTPVAEEPVAFALQSPSDETPIAPRSSAPDGDRYPAPSISSQEFAAPTQSTHEEATYPSALPATPQPHATRTSTARMHPTSIAWLVYLGVFAALLGRMLFGLGTALKLWTTAEPVAFLQVSDQVDLFRLRSSNRVASPVNIGSGILLPADYASWDEEKLRVVLAHERSHIRQGDFYLQLLAGIYASLFWFSPLGWWLKHKLCELGEAISDRAGLQEAASRSSYAQLLLEFAALPRPTLTGVAMARTSHLAQRIERLLNESSFRQAFAAGSRRALLAVLLVPVALIAATAVVRVDASATPVVLAQPSTQVGQAAPESASAPASVAAPTPAAAPVPPLASQEPTPAAMPAPASPQAAPEDASPAPMAPRAPMPPMPAVGEVPPVPPVPGEMPIRIHINPGQLHLNIDSEVRAEMAAARAEEHVYRGMHFDFDGDPYALVGDPGSKSRFNGDWDGDDDRNAEIEKARKVAHGHFLWFRHEGKSFIVDDPAIVSQVEAMNKPMDELGDQMRALGKQMRDLGQQQREIGKQMRDVSVPTPDLSKEMAELNAAVASLQAKQGGTISQKDLGELQGKIGRIQGELGSLQGKIVMQQMNMNGGMGKFGEQQGKLGGQMGELGAQMGKIAHENREKVNGIIDESIKNGKAKPVE